MSLYTFCGHLTASLDKLMVVLTIKIIIREKVYSCSFRIFQFFPLWGGGSRASLQRGKGKRLVGFPRNIFMSIWVIYSFQIKKRTQFFLNLTLKILLTVFFKSCTAFLVTYSMCAPDSYTMCLFMFWVCFGICGATVFKKIRTRMQMGKIPRLFAIVVHGQKGHVLKIY